MKKILSFLFSLFKLEKVEETECIEVKIELLQPEMVEIKKEKEPMYKFGKRSLDNIATMHESLQLLCHELIKEVDITVIEGHRTVERQQELYAQGRTKPGKIVTQLDGVNKLGKHNYMPSQAVDFVPYPIDWNDIERFKDLSILAFKAWDKLKTENKIAENIDLVWGGNWTRFKDYPHYEIKILVIKDTIEDKLS